MRHHSLMGLNLARRNGFDPEREDTRDTKWAGIGNVSQPGACRVVTA
jgi:hypothetical protein